MAEGRRRKRERGSEMKPSYSHVAAFETVVEAHREEGTVAELDTAFWSERRRAREDYNREPRWIPIDRHGNALERGNAHNAATWTMCEEDKPVHAGQCGPEAVHELEGERLDEWLPLEYERAKAGGR